MQLSEMFDLVRGVSRRRRMLALHVVRDLIRLLLLVTVMSSYRASRYRSNKKPSPPCPSPHSHGDLLSLVWPVLMTGQLFYRYR